MLKGIKIIRNTCAYLCALLFHLFHNSGEQNVNSELNSNTCGYNVVWYTTCRSENSPEGKIARVQHILARYARAKHQRVIMRTCARDAISRLPAGSCACAGSAHADRNESKRFAKGPPLILPYYIFCRQPPGNKY